MSESKRILIVGAGGIGKKHIKAFKAADPAVRLYVIEPRDTARAEAAQMGAVVLESSWDDVRLSEFDGVVICAPAPLHVPYVSRCLVERVPVLTEKPLSHTLDGVEELVRLSEAEGAPPSGVAYTRRYIPVHEQAREMVASGKLGKMLVGRITSGQPFASYRPDYRQIYFARREMGGGCMLDFTSHFIDLMQFYLGPVKSACGYCSHSALEGVEVEDTTAVALQFEEPGVTGVIHANQYQPVNENIIDFCGADSCLRIVEPEWSARLFRKGDADWQPLAVSGADYAEGLRRQAEVFMRAIDGGPPMHTSIRDAANTLRVCLEVLATAAQGLPC